jgi:hypothetical protein
LRICFWYQEAEAQLAKYNLTAQRVDGYDGAAMTSAELQHLLNTGVVSVEHDALVMDGSRSVLVSEFFVSHKKKILCIVTLYTEYTRTLRFEICFFQGCALVHLSLFDRIVQQRDMCSLINVFSY